MKAKSIGAIVLMGGMSSRMGTQNKLLLPIEYQSIASYTTKKILEAGYHPVIVVTGYDAPNIRKTLQHLDVVFIHNEHFVEGMGTSIRAGMKGVQGWDGVLIAMGDMPFVSVEILKKIQESLRQNQGQIIAPAYDGKRGQPVLFSSRYFDELRCCNGDIGGKKIVKENKEHLYTFEVSQNTVHSDVDTQKDFDFYKGEFGVT